MHFPIKSDEYIMKDSFGYYAVKKYSVSLKNSLLGLRVKMDFDARVAYSAVCRENGPARFWFYNQIC